MLSMIILALVLLTGVNLLGIFGLWLAVKWHTEQLTLRVCHQLHIWNDAIELYRVENQRATQRIVSEMKK